jgi:hypothetical protein
MARCGMLSSVWVRQLRMGEVSYVLVSLVEFGYVMAVEVMLGAERSG